MSRLNHIMILRVIVNECRVSLFFCCLFISTTSRCCPPPILCKDCARRAQFSCKRVQSRTIALSQMSKIEFTRILPWRAIALLRTCSGYAERSRIFVQASAIELAHIAERSRKSQRKMSRNKACLYCRAAANLMQS